MALNRLKSRSRIRRQSRTLAQTSAQYSEYVSETSPPLLLMDVDGVLNPYPDCPDGFTEYIFFPEDQEPVRLSARQGDWLRELAAHFAMAWASSWEAQANLHLCPHFGLPELPFVLFPPRPFEPSAKVPPIDLFVGHRPVAWVDDIVTAEALHWASERDAPTLLVEVDPAVGLTRNAVDELLAWKLTLT